MRAARLGAVLGAGACAVFLLGACSDDGPEIRRFQGDPTIFTYHGEGSMDAIVSGRLTYLDDEQCIVLETGVLEGVTQRELAVFPAGSDAYFQSDGVLIVETKGFGPLREGVSITAGGGHLSVDGNPDYPVVPAGCSTDGISYAVVQRVTDAH